MANLSKRSAGVRRLLQESAELLNDESPDYSAQPLESDLFDWHFTIRGLSASQFEGGVYHGRMILPSEYPFKPPEIYLLTPSGRFEVNKKICLSISSFHPETWQPSWGVRTALLALISFFESDPKGAVGSLNAPPEERKRLANASRLYKCSTCGYDAADHDSFSALPVPAPEPTPTSSQLAPEKISLDEAGVDEEGEEENDNEVVPETEEVSEANSRSSTPAPSINTIETPSLPPTTIFPSTPHATSRNYPSSSPNALSPSPAPDHHQPSAPSSSSGPARPHHHQPTPSSSSSRYTPASSPSDSVPRLAHSHARIASPLNVSPSSPAPPPRSPTEQPVARIEATALPPGVSLAQADFGGEGGPPSYIDRAILATLLAIVALLVRKVA